MASKTNNTADPLAFLQGGGAMGALIRAYAWNKTALGAPEAWPQSLKTLSALMLGSTQPMFIIWGAERVWLHNDAMIPVMGKKHPSALGQHALEVVWTEAREALAPLFANVFAGTPVQMDDIALQLDRQGKLEEAHFSFSYTPIRDENNAIGGLFGACIETTERVRTEREAKEEGKRFQQLFDQAPTFMAVLRGPEHVFEYANPGYHALVGHREVLGRSVAEALPEAAAQGYIALLDNVYRTGEAYNGRGLKYAVQITPGAPFDDRYVDFVYQPIRDARGDIDGIFVAGVDVTSREFAAVRNKALAELADCIRDIEDPDELAYAAAEVLGRALEVSRAGYGTIDPATETIHITRDWNMPGVQSLAGVLHFRDYGSYIENLKRGETVVVADAYEDPRTAAGADALKAISAQGFVNMPVTEQGGMVALLYLNHVDARRWSEEDLAFIRDVAERIRTAVERRRAEAELRERERRYRALFDAIDEGFCIIEFIDGPNGPLSDYIHVEANPATAVNAGMPGVVGMPASELLGAEASEWVNMYAGVLQTGEPIRLERELETTNRWLEIAAFRIEPPSRAQVAVIFRDLTDRRRAESALRASEENFRTLARAMPNQAWTADPSGMLDWFNERVYAYSGAEAGALDGAGWGKLVHADDIPAASERWADAVRTGETYETEFRLCRADGSYRWHIARAVAIKNDDGQVTRWIGTNTDIHEQKEAAALLEQRVEERTRQLMQAEEALRQSQKMEAVGQLTGGLAHDFNNLLAGISGSLELLAKRIAEGRTTGLERYLSGAQESARRAASLTQRLLAFSRRQTLDPRPIDVNKLVAGMEDLVRRSVGPDITIEVVQAGGLWATRIDAPQLENALLNLCINARDAMAPGGGRLTIETANKWLDERAARDRELPPGQYISLCVTDTGTGMTPDVIARAFDPFFTTKPLGQGTGLGLSMVYGFVRQSGGQIRIYSEVGDCTTICLYLPRHHGEAEEVAPSDAADAIAHGHGERVLVVDDEVVLRMLMLDILQESGYRAIEAHDGPSALKILDSDARIDLLITDVGLPGGMNGRQIADAARKKRPDLKVLFITGYAENAVVGNGHLDPGMQVLTKPFEVAVFGQKVSDMLDG